MLTLLFVVVTDISGQVVGSSFRDQAFPLETNFTVQLIISTLKYSGHPFIKLTSVSHITHHKLLILKCTESFPLELLLCRMYLHHIVRQYLILIFSKFLRLSVNYMCDKGSCCRASSTALTHCVFHRSIA